MEPDSAGIYDFLYADRARISALYAQFFPSGVLTGVKTTAQTSSLDEREFGTDVKVLKTGMKTTGTGSEGIEHQFDASWAVPLEVLGCLKNRSLIRDSPIGAGIGSIILTTCTIRILDWASMVKLAEPSLLSLVATSGNRPPDFKPEMIPVFGEALRAMPNAIHGHFLTKEALLWSSLQPESLTIPINDLTLKYGGIIQGQWNILYLLDAWADNAGSPLVEGWTAGPIVDSLLTGVHVLRTSVGRPGNWLGVTPLMIYRDIAGWRPHVAS
jgi:hypothetical protein